MRKAKTHGLFGLILCVAVLVFSVINVNGVGSNLQYMVPAPAPVQAQGDDSTKPNQAIADLLERLTEYRESDWAGLFHSYALFGIKERVNVAPVDAINGTAQTGRLTALGPNAPIVDPMLYRYGRGFAYEELIDGYLGIVLDEGMALQMFGAADVVGKKVSAEGLEFEIIGIARNSKSVGDREEYGAYIALNALIDTAVTLEVLMVVAKPIIGVGAKSTFVSVVNNWKSGGTLIDLAKEAMGVMMPLRILLFSAGFVVLLMCITWISRKVQSFAADYGRRLKRTYAVRLVPRLAGAIIIFSLAYAAIAFCFAQLVAYVTDPVYTFPEWVPAILVEWADIKTAYWNVWQGLATMQELRSPQLLRLRYFGMLTGWASAGAAVFGVMYYFTLRKKLTLKKDN